VFDRQKAIVKQPVSCIPAASTAFDAFLLVES